MSFLTQKLIWRKMKLLLPDDEKSHGLGTKRESCKKMANFLPFWVKEPRDSGIISDEKRYTICLYRSTRLVPLFSMVLSHPSMVR